MSKNIPKKVVPDGFFEGRQSFYIFEMQRKYPKNIFKRAFEAQKLCSYFRSENKQKKAFVFFSDCAFNADCPIKKYTYPPTTNPKENPEFVTFAINIDACLKNPIKITTSQLKWAKFLSSRFCDALVLENNDTDGISAAKMAQRISNEIGMDLGKIEKFWSSISEEHREIIKAFFASSGRDFDEEHPFLS